MFDDQGADELLRQIKLMEFGQAELQPISLKTHKGAISQIALYEARSTKIDGWSTLIAYFIEKGKAYQNAAKNSDVATAHKLTLTVEINTDGEAVRIIENDNKIMHFKTQP